MESVAATLVDAIESLGIKAGKIINLHGSWPDSDPADHSRAPFERAAWELERVVPQGDLPRTQILHLLPRLDPGPVVISRHAEGASGGICLEQSASGIERNRSHRRYLPQSLPEKGLPRAGSAPPA